MNLIEPEPMPPAIVMSGDGVRIATYLHEPETAVDDERLILAVHGFASSANLNWDVAGWTRVLTRAGYRLLTIDQRGHGASGKPHDPAAYSIDILVDDVLTVLDTYGIDAPHYLGYSLGARVGWRLGVEHPSRVHSLSLGGLPEGDPLQTFDLAAARAHLDHGAPVADPLTAGYFTMAEGVAGNDVEALLALVQGMRGGAHASAAQTPTAPTLLVSGDRDAIAGGSRRLAEATPGASYVSLEGRNHLNAVSSRAFKDAVLAFLAEQ